MKFFKRKPKISPTGRTIDMRKPTWGHNLSLYTINGNVMRYAVWVSVRPKVGDDLIWMSAHGQVRGRIIAVESARNVWDMSFIDVDNVHFDNVSEDEK